MRKETLDIRNFDAGVFRNPDEADIPINAASEESNVDIDMKSGMLRGIKNSISYYNAAAAGDLKTVGWIHRSNTKRDLVFGDTTTLKAIKDWEGTPAACANTETAVAASMTTKGEGVHIGIGTPSTPSTPKWAGWINHGLFDIAAPTDIEFTDDVLAAPSTTDHSFSGAGSGTATSPPTFPAGIYIYAFSWVYDDYQEGALEFKSITAASDYDTIVFTIALDETAVPKRATAIRLYRNPSGGAFYRFLTEYDLTSTSAWTESPAGTWSVSYTDTGDENLAETYEAASGLSQSLNTWTSVTKYDPTVKYTYGCAVDGYLVVANCDSALFDEGARHLVFRSLLNKYSLFNPLALDFVRVPFIPLGIVSHNGKAYVFDKNKFAVINVHGLFIEDVYEGVGAYNHQSIVSTEYGLFWMDKQGAYKLSGGRLEVISRPVRDPDSSEWHGLTNDDCGVFYVPEKESVFFTVFNATSNNINVWAYNVVKGRWTEWEGLGSSSETHLGCFTDAEGHFYYSDGVDNLKQAFGTTTNPNWYWISKIIDIENASQEKKFYNIRHEGNVGNGSITITYGLDGATPTTALTSPDEVKTAGAWAKAKTIQIKIAGTGTSEVGSLSLIFRRMEGNR